LEKLTHFEPVCFSKEQEDQIKNFGIILPENGFSYKKEPEIIR
jgi:hypothetical protein